jgi:dTDP-4-dehydrorhamnose 3,5-epimerase-like enzyme
MKIKDVKTVNFPKFKTEASTLFVYDINNAISINIKRTFTIITNNSCTRGFHAHKECNQLLVVLKGTCYITCDDSFTRNTYLLNNPNQGLLIPSLIWAEQEYAADTIMMVLTDQLYDETDYIRNYNEFLEFRNSL